MERVMDNEDDLKMDQEIAEYFAKNKDGITTSLSPIVCQNRDLIISVLTALVDLMPNILAREGAKYVLKFTKRWMDTQCG
jgi:hypothetical protein